MGLIRLVKRAVGGYSAVQPTDQISCDLTLATVTPTGGAAGKLADILAPGGHYLYKKAINADPTLQAAMPSGQLPVDGMIQFLTSQAGYTPGSNAGQAFYESKTPPGCEFETLVLYPWLGAPTASGGVGLTSSTNPTLATVQARLRASAASLAN